MKAVQSTLWLALVLASPALRADEDKPEIQTQDLGQGIYVLFGEGGNVALSAGSDGNFLVDDKWAPQSGAIKAAVQLVGEGAIRFVINTHWHGDHTGGNENFSNAGAVIVAHDNVRKRMSSDQFIEALKWEVPASAPAALPVVTFGDGLKLHLNGNTVQVIHVAHAHTDGDALVLFTEANILHMGDLYFNGMYPFIDLSSGGSIGGMIAGVEKGLALADEHTKVIPGHGPVTDRAGLQAYRDLLVSWRDAVKVHKDAGASLEQTIAAKPTAATDEALGQGFIKPDKLVEFIYRSL